MHERRIRWDLVVVLVVGLLVFQVIFGNAPRDCKFCGARLATPDRQEQCPECGYWSGAHEPRPMLAEWFAKIVETK